MVIFITALSVFLFQFAQVILQSETIQELTKTSEALALSQEEAAELRKLTDALKTENVSPLFSLNGLPYFLFCLASTAGCPMG